MKKALAQNPNLLRTLLGLSFTLIFLLAYAVYGATISPSYYIYETETTNVTYNGSADSSNYDENSNQTTWVWQIDANPKNLTWFNVTAYDLSSSSTLRITNSAGIYSHPSLGHDVNLDGNPNEDFVCSEECSQSTTHEKISDDGGSLHISTLTEPDPARRSNGTVHADSLSKAEDKARNLVSHEHTPSVFLVEIIEQGNRSTQPTVTITYVNEEFGSIAVFEIDAATEFLWALAAVIGCFAMVLIPSFTVYFAARSKERKNEEKVRLSQVEVHATVNLDDNLKNDEG